MAPESHKRGPLIFLGTADFALPSLDELVRSDEQVAFVVTQPDRPKGRGRHPEPSPVKLEAERLRLHLYQPESINSPDAIATLSAVRPEFLVVVAYGQILRPAVLQLAARGVVNLHPSLLPRHRGPSPVAWSILAGDEEMGVSTMFLDEGMDTGPILLQESSALPLEATRGELELQLSRSGAALLVRTLHRLRKGTVAPRAQDDSQATQSSLLDPAMGRIEWGRPADEIRRLIHALSPRPAAVARVRDRNLKVLRVRAVDRAGPSGHVLGVAESGPVVGCGTGALVLLEVQPEGKRAMSGADFVRGGGMKPGDLLQSPPRLGGKP